MKTDLQAFPTGQLEYDAKGNILFFQKEGMTLRDWFAGMALSGVFADPHKPSIKDKAEFAYKMADAMLSVREAK